MKSRKKTNQNMRIYRPGMLQVGSFERTQRTQPVNEPVKKHRLRFSVMIILFIAIFIGSFVHFIGDSKSASYKSSVGSTIGSVSTKPLAPNECATNTNPKVIIVSLDQQHLWACNFNQVAYSSPVVTGYTGIPADVTPTGTFSIESKQTNLILRGSDGISTWADPVSYWMQFLYNKYGAFGFHDATWRKPNQFGHINTSTTNASKGCVECPLATAKWLYSWVAIGTKVTIQQA